MALTRFVALLLLAATTSASKHELGLSCGQNGACDQYEVELAEEELATEMQVELLQRMPVDLRLVSTATAAASAASESQPALFGSNESEVAALVSTAPVANESQAALLGANVSQVAVASESQPALPGANASEVAALVASAGSEVVTKACNLDNLVGSWKVENALGIKGITVVLDVQPRPSSVCSSVVGVIHYIGKTAEYTITATDLGNGKFYIRYTNEKNQPVYFHEGEYDIAKNVLVEDLGVTNGMKSSDNTNLRLAFARSK
mmetsp:Transcript_15312/g.24409  ORF Transcript_15312/g.24409 Transcript_15312/m.24409 type:complete len:263 (+) Transcript_15312:97-885(+)